MGGKSKRTKKKKKNLQLIDLKWIKENRTAFDGIDNFKKKNVLGRILYDILEENGQNEVDIPRLTSCLIDLEVFTLDQVINLMSNRDEQKERIDEILGLEPETNVGAITNIRDEAYIYPKDVINHFPIEEQTHKDLRFCEYGESQLIKLEKNKETTEQMLNLDPDLRKLYNYQHDKSFQIKKNQRPIELDDYLRESYEGQGVNKIKEISYPTGAKLATNNIFSKLHSILSRHLSANTIGCPQLIHDISLQFQKRLKKGYIGFYPKQTLINFDNSKVQTYKFLTVQQYIDQIDDSQKKKKYQNAFDLWQKYGYNYFEVMADFFMKMNEAQYTEDGLIRSRAIANCVAKPFFLYCSKSLGIDKELFKAILGAASYNIAQMTKYLLEQSNRTHKNKMHFVHAQKAEEIVKLLDDFVEKNFNNNFISTDGSQFDSTRNKYLRQLDIESFSFYENDQLNFLQLPPSTHKCILSMLHQIDHPYRCVLDAKEKVYISGTIIGTTLSGFPHHTTVGNTNTILAINNYISQDIDCECFAAGDDNIIATKDYNTNILVNRLKDITQEKNIPERGKTGIIIKDFDISTNSVSFQSKNYIYPGTYAPQFIRFLRRGSTTQSTTLPAVIRNSIYNDQLVAQPGMAIAEIFKAMYGEQERLEGKLSGREARDLKYKKDAVLQGCPVAMYEASIQMNGSCLLSPDLSGVVIDHYSNYKCTTDARESALIKNQEKTNYEPSSKTTKPDFKEKQMEEEQSSSPIKKKRNKGHRWSRTRKQRSHKERNN